MDLGEVLSLTVAIQRMELQRLDAISRLDWKGTGYPHLWQVLRDALHVDPHRAKQLVEQVELVCPKTGITGQPIEPQLPATRAAMAEGAISAEHVSKIGAVIDKTPIEYREQIDTDLAGRAREFTPRQVGLLGQRIVAALDPDGDGSGR